jgi:hypothetical protein
MPINLTEAIPSSSFSIVSFVPRYKTGETVEINHRLELGVVITTWKMFYPYRSIGCINEMYDDSDTDHCLYSIYIPERNSFNWEYENRLSLYCSDTERGKKILRPLIERIYHNYGIGSFKQSFYDNFLK